MNVFKYLTSKLLLTLFILFCNVLYSQNETESCGTITSEKSLEYLKSIKSQIQEYEQIFFQKIINKHSSKNNNTKSINSIPIKVHVLRYTNGSDGISSSEINEAIYNLNSIYAEAYMEFFLCGDINYIDNDELVHITKGDEKSLSEVYNTPGVINIYFTHSITNASNESICGYSENEGRTDLIFLNNNCATNNSSFAHEMGHFFSLIHTHGLEDTTTELVNGSNCDTDGDGICDTPADPGLTSANINNFCEYTGYETDANGDKYNPDTNNIMSYSGKACRNHFTPQQLARMYAFYQTTKSYLACSTFNANFSVDNNQTCDDTLTVNFNSNCDDITKWEWDIDSDGIIDYTIKNPTHTYSKGIYDVTLKVSNKSKTISKTFLKFIKVGNSITNFNEDFENAELLSDLDWSIKDVSENGYNWLLNKGETVSDKTGPILQKSINNKINTYIYAEASGAKSGDVAELISPCINVDNENSALEFSYHMFGEHMGALHIDLKTDAGYINDIIDPLYGNQQANQGDAFMSKTINLSAYTNQSIKVRFRAVRGANWDSDIAIDNIFIKTIDVPISNYLTAKVYPNPIKNEVITIKTNTPGEIINYSISNVFGQVYLSGTVTNQPINVSNLSSGTYLLTVSNAHYKTVKKIIK
ncbi:T9SS type A sorting domain-containing protein [Thalassobellus suaedae]|uniref:T9SS type A sorting domain-containing protein n=1 Tax=Thalassobellus suaedae TaxID=3074124 RepID=A0ABY9XUY9_9FLAO|nr:T9SS type A sorting domain-containing protein [Flavobacteriaceae bacterium HL-DH14]